MCAQPALAAVQAEARCTRGSLSTLGLGTSGYGKALSVSGTHDKSRDARHAYIRNTPDRGSCCFISDISESTRHARVTKRHTLQVRAGRNKAYFQHSAGCCRRRLLLEPLGRALDLDGVDLGREDQVGQGEPAREVSPCSLLDGL